MSLTSSVLPPTSVLSVGCPELIRGAEICGALPTHRPGRQPSPQQTEDVTGGKFEIDYFDDPLRAIGNGKRIPIM